MKIMYCESCGDLVVPHNEAYRPRWCGCTRAAVWWENPATGQLKVYHTTGKHCVSVIGIHNDLLRAPFPKYQGSEYEHGSIQRKDMDAILEATDQHYLFKTQHSLIIRVRPGFTGDIKFTGEYPHPDKLVPPCDTTPPDNAKKTDDGTTPSNSTATPDQ